MTEAISELQIDEENVSCIFRAINKRGDGKINFHEFLEASLDCNIIVREENLIKVFKFLACNSGGISARKLKQAFGSGAEVYISDNQWEKLVTDVKGGQSSGEIVYQEFKDHMMKVIQERERKIAPAYLNEDQSDHDDSSQESEHDDNQE